MPDDLMQYWEAFRATLQGVKTATEIWLNLKGEIPEGEDREKLEAALNIAFTSAEQATALLAQKLDFKLCKCEFPGTPMLLDRRDEWGEEIVKCPKCGDEFPPEIDPPEENVTFTMG
jgi:hypothetical protein